MFISRRQMLWLLGGITVASAEAPAQSNSRRDDRLRCYRADATVSIFSIPVFARDEVGTAFILIEESGANTAIHFGAGSYPERAHGLNRLGYMQEFASGPIVGNPLESASYGFMTACSEKNIDQARRALTSSDTPVAYAVVAAKALNGTVTSCLTHITLPSTVTWRDYPGVSDQVEAAVAAPAAETRTSETKLPPGQAAPLTFLHAARCAIQTARVRCP